MESFKQRLKRYTTKDDLEIFGWLLVFLQNEYVPEIRLASKNRLYYSVYLMTHAIMQMVSEKMFGLKGKEGTRFFLKNFVDGASHDTRFSLVTEEIHDVRNVMAHQGYSSLQHRVEYFSYEIREGWKKDKDIVHINPAKYAECFERRFTPRAVTAKYRQLPRQKRTIRKYQFIRQWLGLDKRNPIAKGIVRLEACGSMQQVQAEEAVIQKMILMTYNLN